MGKETPTQFSRPFPKGRRMHSFLAQMVVCLLQQLLAGKAVGGTLVSRLLEKQADVCLSL